VSLKILRAVNDLRHELPGLVGDGWPAIADDVTGLLDRIAAAANAAEREPLIDRLLELLAVSRDAYDRARTALSGAEPTGAVFRGAGSFPSMAAGDAEAATLKRTPHLDVNAPDPVPPGTTFDARVYADTRGFAPGETGTALALPARGELKLSVWLVVSAHFEVLGEDSGFMTIRRDANRSDVVVFRLRAIRATAESEESGISALFALNGRPVGSVRRLLQVAEESRAPVSVRAARSPDPALVVEPTARQPDLTVEIERMPGGGDQQFSCRVSTPLLAEYTDGVTAPWELRSTTGAIVRSYMAGFTSALASDEQRRAALVGAGVRLFDAAPENFRHAYGEIVGAGHPLCSIYVVSSEPYIPWELMIPKRNGEPQDALGVAHSVGRWVHDQHVSPLQRIAIEDSYVIAPRYRGAKTLSFSQAEAEFVCAKFSGREIRPALFANIESELGSRGVTLLHVICHGTAGDDGSQAIELDPDETLNDFTLEGMKGVRRAVATKKPFVFINACEVGRPAPALVGTGGFAAAFIALGARCVIAPIWSVKDSVAGKAALEFYQQVLDHPERPFAEILRDLRRRAYEGDDVEDSWAAYCFYGDPLAAHGVP
jgi:CHAT domain